MGYMDDDRVILSKGSIDKTGAKNFNRTANVPDNYVVELQQDLTGLGFTSGSADGCFGTHTDEALRAFQEAARGDKRTKDGKAITVSPSYRGEVHGECDQATCTEIRQWKDSGYRSFWPLPPSGSARKNRCRKTRLNSPNHLLQLSIGRFEHVTVAVAK